MKKLQSPNSNYFAFFIIIIADVSFLYNLIQYIRYGLDTYLYGFIISLGIPCNKYYKTQLAILDLLRFPI